MVRILIISAQDVVPWGAAEELWYATAVELLQRHVDLLVSVKGWSPDPCPVRNLQSLGARIHRRADSLRTQAGAGNQSSANEQHGFMEAFRPALVVISQPDNFSGLGWMTACRTLHIPYVTVVHYASETEWPNDHIVFDLAAGYEASLRNFFVSTNTLRLTERQIASRVPRAEVVRCPFKVPYDKWLPWPEDASGLRLACVARLDPVDKGQDVIFEVLCMPKWRNRPLSVTLFGDGPFKRSLEALVAFWRLDSVHFAGFSSEVTNIWRSHHGLILGSRAEGLPTAVVEAMLLRRVCVVTDVGGSTEVIEDGVTGFIAQYSRAAALDEAMERLWQSRDSLRLIGERAGESVRKAVPPSPASTFCDRLLSLL